MSQVNANFLELYESEDFIRTIQDDWLPWLLGGIELGDDVLELVAGPGSASPRLRAMVPGLTVAQLDPALTPPLHARFADDSGVQVRDVDPTQLPFANDSFSAAVAVLALHHIESAEAQDQTLQQLLRVLRPGGVLAGLNAIDGPHFRRLSAGDASVPVEPMNLAERLKQAGFVNVEVNVWSFVRFVAYKTTGDAL